MITEFPQQLIEALQIEPADLSDLNIFLQVPLDLLNTLLIQKGIISGVSGDDYAETLVDEEMNQ